MYTNTGYETTGAVSSPEVTVAYSHSFRSAETTVEREEERRKERKKDDLWALGNGEPHEYPSLSRGEGRANEKKGLDGGECRAEGEGANRAPNHILDLGLFWVYIYAICMYVSVQQMWGSEG